MRNSANTAGSREETVGFNLLPYEMQPGKILHGNTPLARPGERGRGKHPMTPLSRYSGVADPSQYGFLPELCTDPPSFRKSSYMENKKKINK